VHFVGVVTGITIPRLELYYLLAISDYVIERVIRQCSRVPLVLGMLHVFGSHVSNLPSLCIRCKCILLLENNY